MRWKQGFILRLVAGEYVLVPVGDAAKKLRGMLGLSASGCLLYNRLQEDCTRQDLIEVLLAEYDVDPQTAGQDVDDFLKQMNRLGLLEE